MAIPFGAVLTDTGGNSYFKAVIEYFWVNQLDDLMSKTIEKDWMVLV